ncbi:N-terminal Xaa-Pro-Lys N-methyltransferase 1-like [Oppia nitens]|uniref:N-terminal Xaa-Pro-Lys N-methyltransferase 1-like n=1 Tax=Oppia nitens TaxID=1686743 RepID=UPI0023DC3B81|nr:N-terminal Xaa-Pro-Lys N-methyltransferase 1-like [Oppia nitens]
MSINGRKVNDGFYSNGRDYWSQVEPTLDGMLGGFTTITGVDITASKRLLNKYFKELDKRSTDLIGNKDNDDDNNGQQQQRVTRALDCGAGIGRVSKHLLLKYFDSVDLLEQNPEFLTEAKTYIGSEDYKRIGNSYNSGLQDFTPDPDIKYDCIWIQWVTGHLADDDFVQFLGKCKSALNQSDDGIIVVKDNTTQSDECDDDTNDSSVTRPHWLFIDIFKRANLELICERKQYKMPKGLYPVYMFVLK